MSCDWPKDWDIEKVLFGVCLVETCLPVCVHTMVHGADGSAACVVLCLCGLPGAGKSTLARALQRHAEELAEADETKVWHVCFDDYEDGMAAAAEARCALRMLVPGAFSR